MRIRIHLDYHTEWGEAVYISGNIPELGSGDKHEAPVMEMTAPDVWAINLELPDCTKNFNYCFLVKAEGREWREEWGAPHRFDSGHGIAYHDIHAYWQDVPTDKPYYSSAFVEGMLNRNYRDQNLARRSGTTVFRVLAPMVMPDEVLAVSGEHRILGAWNPAKALIMNDAHYPVWEAAVDMDGVTLPMEYKFVILDKKTLEVKDWEARSNRRLDFFPAERDSVLVFDGIRLENPRKTWKGSGTAIPVFSLRTSEDEGVGDFHDIKKMVDWCVATGQKILQVLPINDTTKTGTWTDSYPYSANSTFALHPMYLRLQAAGHLKDKARREEYRKEFDNLNLLPQIDYEKVNDLSLIHI